MEFLTLSGSTPEVFFELLRRTAGVASASEAAMDFGTYLVLGHGMFKILNKMLLAITGDEAPATATADPRGEERKGDFYMTVRVTIISARGLRNAGSARGESDPFVTCEVPRTKKQFQTKVLSNDKEPKWDHTAEIIGLTQKDTIKFHVWGHDTLTAKDTLGHVSISKKEIIPNGFEGELKLLDCDPTSAVHHDSYLKVKVEMVQSYAEEAKVMEIRTLTKEEMKESDPKGAPKVTVTMHSAKGLRNADWVGNSDPYGICEVPGKPNSRVMTAVVDDKSDPVWEEKFEIKDFEVGDSLAFAVMDKDVGSDELLGRAKLEYKQFYPLRYGGELKLKDSGLPMGQNAYLKVSVLVEFPDDPDFKPAVVKKVAAKKKAAAKPKPAAKAEA